MERYGERSDKFLYSEEDETTNNITYKFIKRTIDIKPSIRSTSERDNKIVMVLKAGQNQEIPSLRPDTAMELFKPEIKFDMKRTKFFDGSLEEIDL